MKKITILCGLPRCGKTSWAEKYKEANEVVISGDLMRRMVYNQYYWDSGEAFMWSIYHTMLRYLMEQGVDIIVDETNHCVKRRSAIVKNARQYGYEIEAIVFEVDVQKCVDRALAENKDRLAQVIRKMGKYFEIPTIEEGFSHITFYK